MSAYFVTGAAGFLGSHLVRNLAAHGHEVTALVRKPRATPGGARDVVGDLLEVDTYAQALAGVDGVFHCAGLVSRDDDDAEAMHRLHVIGTRRLLEAARAAGVPRVVLASTSGTVGISEDAKPIADERSPVPLHLIQKFPYYRTKLFAEEEALAANAPGFAVLSVNPSLLLGPGDVHGSSTKDVWRFLDRSIPAVPRGGMSYVDVRDAAEALRLAMERGRGGERYLVTGTNVTMRTFFDRLERASGVPAPKLDLPKNRAVTSALNRVAGRVVKAIGGEPPVDDVSLAMGQLYWWVDASKAERELGFAPRDPMQTLVDTVADLRGEFAE